MTRTPIEQPEHLAAQQSKDERIRLVQLSDPHLYADPHGCLLGQETRRTFELTLELAAPRLATAERLLLTGDLVHDESRSGYRYFKELLDTLDLPYHCLPGNHDIAPLMREVFGSTPQAMPFSVRTGRWHILLLDSVIPGENGGHLAPQELQRLEEELAAHPDAYALVCLHHQPLPIGSRWLDTMSLDNPHELFAILDRHPQVRGILFGHIHQEVHHQRKGVVLLGSPSTCIQFLPGSADFSLDPRPPGLRWLELHPDGTISTGIERIAAYPDPFVPHYSGY